MGSPDAPTTPEQKDPCRKGSTDWSPAVPLFWREGIRTVRAESGLWKCRPNVCPEVHPDAKISPVRVVRRLNRTALSGSHGTDFRFGNRGSIAAHPAHPDGPLSRRLCSASQKRPEAHRRESGGEAS